MCSISSSTKSRLAAITLAVGCAEAEGDGPMRASSCLGSSASNLRPRRSTNLTVALVDDCICTVCAFCAASPVLHVPT